MSTYCQSIENIINPLATLVAAFGGVWFAFLFEKNHKKEEDKKKNIASVNRALYTIYNMWNILCQYNIDIIKPCKSLPDAWLNMAATLPSSNGLSTFAYDDLAFIFQSETPNVYSNLLLEEQRFNLAINIIQARSSIVLNQVFPRLSAAGINPGKGAGKDVLEEIIGIDNVHKLKLLTKSIIENVTQDLSSLISVHDELRSAMKIMYPNAKFIFIKFENKNGDT